MLIKSRFFPYLFTEHEWTLMGNLKVLEGGGGKIPRMFIKKLLLILYFMTLINYFLYLMYGTIHPEQGHFFFIPICSPIRRQKSAVQNSRLTFFPRFKYSFIPPGKGVPHFFFPRKIYFCTLFGKLRVSEQKCCFFFLRRKRNSLLRLSQSVCCKLFQGKKNGKKNSHKISKMGKRKIWGNGSPGISQKLPATQPFYRLYVEKFFEP